MVLATKLRKVISSLFLLLLYYTCLKGRLPEPGSFPPNLIFPRDPPSIPNPCTPVRPPPLPCPSHIFTNSSVRHALISEITPHCPSTVHCPLSTVHWPLSTFHFPLTTVHFPLSTVHCPVFTVQCSLSTPHSPLPTVHSLSEL